MESSDYDKLRDRNMNSLYNAFTEVYKGNLLALPQRSEALHSVLDSEVGFHINPTLEDAEEGELVEVGVAEADEVVGDVEEYYPF